jgi:hypothetical protein
MAKGATGRPRRQQWSGAAVVLAKWYSVRARAKGRWIFFRKGQGFPPGFLGTPLAWWNPFWQDY